MNQNNAAHIAALEDLRLGVELDRHHLDDGDAKLAALDAALALLSKLRAPVADERAAFAGAEISFPMSIPGNRVYLAGPMTGHENHNFPAFHAAAERLRASGLEVVNPADHGLVSGLGWADYMRWDLVKLAGCHSVYVLPGWDKSKGASLEVSIARALGMPVFTVEGAALASAPVAGEAQKPVAWGTTDDREPISDALKRAHPRYATVYNVPLYAAPQASEAECSCPSGDGSLRHPCAVHPQASEAVRDAAFEAVRKQLCKLPRYSFFASAGTLGGVRRVEDRSGNWIDFDAAHALFDPVSVDAALSAQPGAQMNGGQQC